MRATKVLILGIPAFATAIAACSTAVGNTPEPSPPALDSDSPAAADDSEPAAASIQLGEISLKWEESKVGEGIKPAVAIDDDGVAHVTFLTEADHGGIFYAHNSNGDFEVETVAEGYFYGPIDLALDLNAEPLIAYHDHQALQVDMALGDAVIAHLSENGWNLTTVADEGHDGWDNSIAVDQDGVWHAAGIDPSQFGGQDGVEHATLVDGVITVSPVGSGPIKYEFGTSVQVDPSGSPSVAYYNDRDQQLELASLGTDGWSVELVDDQGDAGRYASLAFDSNGMPHIAYFAAEGQDSGSVRHAWRDGSKWQMEVVDDLSNVRMGHIGARKITSLAFDGEGGLHLAYTDRDRVVYSQKTGDEWASQEVVEPGSRELGQLVELAIDSDGTPHLVWYEVIGTSPGLQGLVVYAKASVE